MKSFLHTQRHAKKALPGDPRLYVLQINDSVCVLCSLSSAFYFIGDKFSVDIFNDEITPSLKENAGVKFDQYMALNHIREKVKPQYKLSYKVFKEQYGYYKLLGISPYTTLIQLKKSLGRIHHCVSVVGKWIFDISFTFALTLTKENLGYCQIHDN